MQDFLYCSLKERAKPFVRDTHTHSELQDHKHRDSIQAGTVSDLYNDRTGKDNKRQE